MRARLAWVLCGLTLVLVVADVVVTAQYRSLRSEDAIAVHGFPFVDAAVLGCAVMGAVIVTSYERHPIGWLLNVIGFTSAISLLTEAYAIWVISEGGPGSRSLGGISAWVSSLVGGQLAIAGLALMFLLAPDGRFLSRGWRYAAVGDGARRAAVHPGSCSRRTPPRSTVAVESEEVGPVRAAVLSAGFLLISAGLLASVVSMVVRLRRSEGEQRQQVRLIALSATLVALGLVVPLRGAELQRRRADLGSVGPAVPVATCSCRSCLPSPCCATASTTSR